MFLLLRLGGGLLLVVVVQCSTFVAPHVQIVGLCVGEFGALGLLFV